MRLTNTSRFIIAVTLSELAGIIGSVFTMSQIPTWYVGLMKPALNPPSWVFGPVWTILYFMMGVAAFLVWRRGGDRIQVRQALVIFGIQLVLNTLWSIIFFNAHQLLFALIWIVLLLLAIVWTIVVFARISRPAASLLVPYLAWVSFATYLNGALYWLNRGI